MVRMMIIMLIDKPVGVWGVSRKGVVVGFVGIAVLPIKVVPTGEVKLVILR